jgi:hypothetical protein
MEGRQRTGLFLTSSGLDWSVVLKGSSKSERIFVPFLRAVCLNYHWNSNDHHFAAHIALSRHPVVTSRPVRKNNSKDFAGKIVRLVKRKPHGRRRFRPGVAKSTGRPGGF